MFVKLSLDEKMSEWLMTVSANECRSNAQQVLYWLKRIKEGQRENELEPNASCKVKHVIYEAKEETEESKRKSKQSKEEQHTNIQDEGNLSMMLDFI